MLQRHPGALERVALWAQDATHYDIVKSVASGGLQVVWGVMDQDFTDRVSTVRAPAPLPPAAEVRAAVHSANCLLKSVSLCGEAGWHSL